MCLGSWQSLSGCVLPQFTVTYETSGANKGLESLNKLSKIIEEKISGLDSCLISQALKIMLFLLLTRQTLEGAHNSDSNDSHQEAMFPIVPLRSVYCHYCLHCRDTEPEGKH